MACLPAYLLTCSAFRDEFLLDLGPGLIEEVVVGCGPCGELRYPAYPEANGWRFPVRGIAVWLGVNVLFVLAVRLLQGVDNCQCYDRRSPAAVSASRLLLTPATALSSSACLLPYRFATGCGRVSVLRPAGTGVPGSGGS